MSNRFLTAPAATRKLRRFLAAGLELLLPQACALCGQGAGKDAVCADCQAALPTHGRATCPQCGDVSVSELVCGHCLNHPPHFDAAFAAFEYRFPVDRLVQRLKYAGHLHLAPWFSLRLAERLSTRPEEFDLLVPMPLHPTRLQERGFNQAAEIARRLATSLDVPLALALCSRTRATPRQADLERSQRLKNVRGAFACSGDVTGKRIVILDDVMTTGASMNELARVLKWHGAARVTALAAARTLHS